MLRSLHDSQRNSSPAEQPKSDTDLFDICSLKTSHAKKRDAAKSKERLASLVKDFLKNVEHTQANSTISLEYIVGNSKATLSTTDLSELECKKGLSPIHYEDNEFNISEAYNDEQFKHTPIYPHKLEFPTAKLIRKTINV